jgi:hypothetical protein
MSTIDVDGFVSAQHATGLPVRSRKADKRKNIFFVKYLDGKKGTLPGVHLGDIRFPITSLGKRVRFKIEVIE